MIKLRDYQQKIINNIRTSWIAKNTKIAVQAPTGAG